MSVRLKVYGGLSWGRGRRQVRTIVAARNQREAADLVGIDMGYMRGFWSVTGNAREIDTAMGEPFTVFRASSSLGDDFVK
jgi:hypothetical protein